MIYPQNDLRELEEMCTEMGDRMQDRIDEQQEQIDQVSHVTISKKLLIASTKYIDTQLEDIYLR